MRYPTALALVAVLAAAAGAQTPFNPLKIYDGSTEFTSRGNLGTAQGRLIQCLPGDASAGASTLKQVQYVIQDQAALASPGEEAYIVEVLPDDGSGQPDVTNPLLQVPMLFPAGTGGAAAYSISVTLTTPLAIPCDQSIYLSVQVPANANWNADGLSIHISVQDQVLDNREIPKGEPNSNIDLAWQEIGGVVSEPSLERCWNMTFYTDSVALQPFAETPAFTSVLYGSTSARAQDFGQAGRFPDLVDVKGEGRLDNIGWKAIGHQFDGTAAPAILYMSLSNLGQNCVPLPPLGNLWLDPTDPLVTASFGPANLAFEDGSGGFTWGPFNPPPFIRAVLATSGVPIHTQAIVFDPAPVFPPIPWAISNGTTQFY